VAAITDTDEERLGLRLSRDIRRDILLLRELDDGDEINYCRGARREIGLMWLDAQHRDLTVASGHSE
jgi:hypothetical protein